MNELKHHSKSDLLVLFHSIALGDAAAFEEIYLQFYNRLMRYGLIIYADKKVVEDAVQDLFIWMLEHPKELSKVKEVEVYLFSALKNNLQKYGARKNRISEILNELVLENRDKKSLESIDCQIIATEEIDLTRKWMHKTLDQLPAHQKEIIYLRFYENLSYDDISSMLSISNQVIRNYVTRAIKQIRQSNLSKKIHFLLLFFA